MTPTQTPGDVESQRDALTEKLFDSLLGGMELLSVHVGLELGLYSALVETPATARELADRARIHERYAREWLEQQAIAGYVDVAEETGDAHTRSFVLPAGHAEALLDPNSPGYIGAAAAGLAGLGLSVPAVVDAYRSGGGVAYADYGHEIRHAIAGFNKPAFVNDLAGWIDAVPDVASRVSSTSARVLDLGCGVGWSTIAFSQAYPHAQVIGIDLDDASIDDARKHAAAEGAQTNLRFEVGDVTDVTAGEPVDLALIFEALHDMAHPVEVLRSVRDALVPGGSLIVGDEKVAESFGAFGDEIERFNYGWSVLHCLPATRAESPSVDAGTVLRSDTVRDYAAASGFGEVEILPVEHDFWRFYRFTI